MPARRSQLRSSKPLAPLFWGRSAQWRGASGNGENCTRSEPRSQSAGTRGGSLPPPLARRSACCVACRRRDGRTKSGVTQPDLAQLQMCKSTNCRSILYISHQISIELILSNPHLVRGMVARMPRVYCSSLSGASPIHTTLLVLIIRGLIVIIRMTIAHGKKKPKDQWIWKRSS